MVPALPAWATSLIEFDRWMQEIDHHSQSVLRHINLGEVDAADADARALVSLYRRMGAFYEQRDAADAVLASDVGREQAEVARSALATGDLGTAFEAASSLARDCRSCHRKYKPMAP